MECSDKALANDALSALLGTQNGQCIKQSPKVYSTKNKKFFTISGWRRHKQEAHKAFGQFETRYSAKYPKAAEFLTKGKV
ncbi:hypothetical protein BTN49_1765 [Candidatus Enterovibrio escicola]|uniref:Uncharacterized protein n=1 Tax=Candidatus Enterovibrio escicola TaxID=1927127 RepID=A0A2A5T319_9GAMM|nr:hypothetical protein BTN49_1765 [Candidatus Enterovibrio escacola]